MTLRIDKAGRVVLPKSVRDRLGLREGSHLDLVETAEGVILKPISREPSLVKKGRFLVHTGQLPSAYDLQCAIKEDREERSRKVF